MKCKQCGAELISGEKFCRVCGARVNIPAKAEMSAPEKQDRKSGIYPKKKTEKKLSTAKADKGQLPLKKIAIAVVVVLVVAFVVGAILLFAVDRSPIMKSDDDRPFTVVTAGVAGRRNMIELYAADGSSLVASGSGWQVSESVWNGSTALLTYEGFLTVNGHKGGFPPLVYTVRTSADGSKVAYISGYDGNTGDGGKLYVYDVKKNDNACIDNNVTEINAISPSGTAVSYTAYDKDSDAYHVRISRNAKKGERLLDCEKVFGVSNDGKLIYFLNDGKLYAMKDGVRTRLCEYSTSVTQYYNADCTQLLYACDGGCFVVRNGAEIEELSNAKHSNGPIVCTPARGSTIADAAILPIKSFYETVLDLGGELHYFDHKDGELRDLNFGRYRAAVASTDGKKLAYVGSEGVITYIKKLEHDYKTTDIYPEAADAGASSAPTVLYADEKLSNIYYTNSKGELWQAKNGKVHMVSADVSNVCVGGDGTVYFVYDGVVLCRANGSERVSIERREGMTALQTVPQGVVALTTRDGVVYYRNGGEGMVLVTP